MPSRDNIIILGGNEMQIEMKGIDKSFGTNQVLKDAGFVLGHGEVHALMGENGAGHCVKIGPS